MIKWESKKYLVKGWENSNTESILMLYEKRWYTNKKIHYYKITLDYRNIPPLHGYPFPPHNGEIIEGSGLFGTLVDSYDGDTRNFVDELLKQHYIDPNNSRDFLLNELI